VEQEHSRRGARYGGKEPPEWVQEGLRRARTRNAQAPPESSARAVSPEPRRLVPAAVALVAALALVLGGVALGRLLEEPSSPGPAAREQGPPAPPPEPVSAVARELLPSAVQIETDDGIGSGFLYDRRGLILTAAHVVSDRRRVTVRFSDGRRVKGRVVGAHDLTDVAVVRAPRRGLPVARLELDAPPQVGQLAIAIGSPFGLEGSVTAGVISAVERSLSTKSGRPSSSMIQTDAPINPGNSGGALANRRGRVIGINDAIRSRTGVNSGVGFAIPIDTALSVAEALLKGRPPRIGFLGVSGTEPPRGRGALVTDVVRGGPAHRAGLRRGDIVTAIDGRPVDGMGALVARIRSLRPGSTVTLEIKRGQRRLDVEVRIGDQ
jgi:S1-C subfamily serine protease